MLEVLLFLLLLAPHPTPGQTEFRECGRVRPRPRIVGGTDAMPGDWPWQVSVHRNGYHICGASLISEYWVLSAAHCVVLNQTVLPAEEYSIYLGSYTLMEQENEDYLNVAEILVPDDYIDGAFGSDIALLRLGQPASFSEFVQTVCLPQANHHFSNGAPCWITGWGYIEEVVVPRPPMTLQEVQVKIIGPQTCQCLYNSPGPYNTTYELLPGMICAGFKEGRKDTCQGDSGGPLVCEEAGQWFLAGITSFGNGCARRNRPGVYTAVSAYESWIRERVTGASFPSQPQPVLPDEPEEPQNCTLALPECGSASLPGPWPWKATLVIPASEPCHGFLVSESWLLVPASCFLDLKIPDQDVDSIDLSDWQVILPASWRWRPVLSIAVNRNYTEDSGYDLALVEFEALTSVTQDTRPVCLPDTSHYFLPNSRCQLAPWGLGDAASFPDYLLEAKMMNPGWCYCLHGQEGEEVPQPRVDPRMLCADYLYEDNERSCWAGRRWSLMCQESGTWFLAGISDYTTNCLRPRVFTPLQLHQHWIRHNTLTPYIEDQLVWNFKHVPSFYCPRRARYGACGFRHTDGNLCPWMVEVYGNRSEPCIGSLVSPDWVLVATDCLSRQLVGEVGLQVYLGTAGPRNNLVPRTVTSIQLSYGFGTGRPLTFLKLNSRVESSPSALPVCLHSGSPPIGRKCWVLGWKEAGVPMAFEVRVLTPEYCNSLHNQTLSTGTICVTQHTQDTLMTDIGTSLLCEDRGTWILVGIGIDGSQELFTAVGPHRFWVSRIVEEAPFLSLTYP